MENLIKIFLWTIFILITFMALNEPITKVTYIGYPLFVVIYLLVFKFIKK